MSIISTQLHNTRVMSSPYYPNQALSLQVVGDKDDWYPSLVLDFVDGNELVIGVPTSKGNEVFIKPGTAVLLEVTLRDGLRRMTSVVRSRRPVTPASLVLDWPKSEERIQRRNDVRVDTMFNAHLRPIIAGGKLGAPLHGLVMDISAGGARIFVADPLAFGTNVELTLHLPAIGERVCDARVVRGAPNAALATTHPHWVGVVFTDLSQSLRREITKLVFDIQRDLRKKGLT